MKRKIKIFILAIVGILIGYVIYNYNEETIGNLGHRDEVVDIDQDWKEISSVPAGNDTSVIKVEWDQKYGRTRTEYCKAVFSNQKTGEIKLVAPWKTVVIKDVNMNDLTYSLVSNKMN